VREVRRSERLGCDPTGFEELERELTGRRELRAPSDDEHPPRVRERDRDVPDPLLD
jgi:hypothetical protein